MPCCASSDSFFFLGGGGVINIACVLCGCFTGESWLKTEKKTNVIKKSNNACAQLVLRVMFFPFIIIIFFLVGGVLSKHVLCKSV